MKISWCCGLVILPILLCCPAEASDGGMAYIMGFEIETYIAVTEKNIETTIKKPCLLKSPGIVKDVLLTATPTPLEFDQYRVRAEISEGDISLLIDRNGVFVLQKKSLRISEVGLHQIVKNHGGC